jgi:hypothetical protein
MTEFERILYELFHMYIYLNAKKTKNCKAYNRSFINLLTTKNTDNPYYNKITATIMTKKFPPNCKCYVLNT